MSNSSDQLIIRCQPLQFLLQSELSSDAAGVCRIGKGVTEGNGGWIEPVAPAEPDVCSASAEECIPVEKLRCDMPAKLLSNAVAAEVPVTKSSQGTTVCPMEMVPCPPGFSKLDPVPAGWQLYHGYPSVFHCNYAGLLQNCDPAPSKYQNECFYNEAGKLVDKNSSYAACRGTPNENDSDKNFVKHIFSDDGGIIKSGPRAFLESRKHDFASLFGWYQYLVYRIIR